MRFRIQRRTGGGPWEGCIQTHFMADENATLVEMLEWCDTHNDDLKQIGNPTRFRIVDVDTAEVITYGSRNVSKGDTQ